MAKKTPIKVYAWRTARKEKDNVKVFIDLTGRGPNITPQGYYTRPGSARRGAMRLLQKMGMWYTNTVEFINHKPLKK